MSSSPLRAAEISLPAIRHNIAALRRVTGSGVIVVVKANAYGHGAAIVAPVVIDAGAEMVAVASLDEAIALRETGFTAPLLCWLHGERIDYRAAIHHGIDLGLSRAEQVRELATTAASATPAAAAGSRGRARVQLKLDTGLSRNDAAPDTWHGLFETAAAAERSGAIHVSGVFSHLANAGPAADRAQAARFDAAIRCLHALGVRPSLRHLAASAATLTSPHLRYDAVRVGLAAYGLSPVEDRSAHGLGLRPAMTLASQIVALRRVPAGTGVSYDHTHVCAHDTVLALVPIGYADGMPRALNGTGATVSICGERAPIVGRIGMDQCIIDVTPIADRVRIGERVVLFGDPDCGHPAVEEWAERLHTINYEIIAGIGHRVHRVPVSW
ncbi:MAG: alanine racemase [Leucobacter sp.]